MHKKKKNTDVLVELLLFHAIGDALIILEEKPQVGKGKNRKKKTRRTTLL